MTDREGANDEADLVRAVAAGSEDALGILYDRHVNAIYAAANRLTSDRQAAEEVVQETFLALWNRAETFNPASGSLAAWLHAIARNRTVDRLRAAARRPTVVAFSSVGGDEGPDADSLERLVASGAVVGGADLGPGPEGELEATQTRAAIGDALATMPETEREVITLAYREELTQSEIAERLGWPLGTVKTRTRRALLRLRAVLSAELRPASVVDEIALTDLGRGDDGPR